MPILPLILQLLVGLPSLIATAEKAFSGRKGSGKAKKKLVMDSAETALNVAAQLGKLPVNAEEQAVILGAVSQLTDTTVDAINAVKKEE